jgi:hypothetical protein
LKKSVYLETRTLQEALAIWREKLHAEGIWRPLGEETVRVAGIREDFISLLPLLCHGRLCRQVCRHLRGIGDSA